MPNYTITYSESLKGWTSFHSYEPQWMAGLNNDFYTFKGGKVWKHHSNQTRNNYYGQQYNSVVRTILNTEPDTVKVFKTIKLKGTGDTAWAAQVVSDLGGGLIPFEGYVKKEGNWYGYIRRNDGDLSNTFLSTKGLGVIFDTGVAGDVVSIYVVGDVRDGISVKTTTPVPRDNGDLLFTGVISGENITSLSAKLGQVLSVSYSASTNQTEINMVKHPLAAGPPVVPSDSLYLMSAKSSAAESYGLRGVYMDVTLTNSETDHTELFSISSEVLKSYQ
jgi:hypothetical protein